MRIFFSQDDLALLRMQDSLDKTWFHVVSRGLGHYQSVFRDIDNGVFMHSDSDIVGNYL